MTGRGKKKADTGSSDDLGATASSTDVLLQLLQQQQKQQQQQQEQFMLQQQQMTEILAKFSTVQQGAPETQLSTQLPTNSTTNVPKAQFLSPDKLRLDVTLRGAQE